MDINDYTPADQIKVLMALEGVSTAELARRLKTTRQNMGQRLKRGAFTPADLEEIATALGYKTRIEFVKMYGTSNQA